MVQVLEHMPTKFKALSSNASTTNQSIINQSINIWALSLGPGPGLLKHLEFPMVEVYCYS
jgi:hypothetical protein